MRKTSAFLLKGILIRDSGFFDLVNQAVLLDSAIKRPIQLVHKRYHVKSVYFSLCNYLKLE